MSKEELISVIMPTFNREKTIIRAINSVLAQTYSNIELIIIDDCSTDNTEELIKKVNDSRVLYYKLDENSGACKARNIGIDLANGKYIAFQDSDDEWQKEKLEIQLENLVKTESDFNFCAFNRIMINEKRVDKIPEEDLSDLNNYTEKLFIENFISTQTILAKKEVFKEEKFDERLPRYQDWDLVIRISKKFKISYTDKILVNVYMQKDSVTNNPQKGYNATRIIYNKYKDEIDENINIKYEFKTRIARFLFYMGKECKKELKESLNIKFNIKIFIFYISCITKTNKILLRILNKIKG